jgi:hypothetical protein
MKIQETDDLFAGGLPIAMVRLSQCCGFSGSELLHRVFMIPRVHYSEDSYLRIPV